MVWDMMDERICAVIVTYSPDISRLYHLLDRLQGQVDQVCIVDNSSPPLQLDGRRLENIPIKLLDNQNNVGIGRAHNQGLRLAVQQGFSHALLLDQDSFPDRDMVEKLLHLEQKSLLRGFRIAAVGPQVLDAGTGRPEPIFRSERWWVRGVSCARKLSCEVSYLIASGTLIRLDTLDRIGFFTEALFIDLVDVEWGLRATEKGFSLLVCCDARLWHTIGSRQSVGPGIWMTRHAPERLYYQFRNYFLLLRQYIPAFSGWFLYHGLRRLVPRFFLFMVIPPRLRHCTMMLRGIRDGLTAPWPDAGGEFNGSQRRRSE